jgi:phosphate:Na+ symporter
LQKARLELVRLGELVLQMTRRGLAAAIEGKADELEAVRNEGTEIGRLPSAILQYIGRLSEGEHSAEESREIIGLIEDVNNLGGIVDVVSTNLVATGRQRSAEHVDLLSLRDENTSRFSRFVIERLEAIVAALGDTNTRQPMPFAAWKTEMDSLAAAARRSVFERIRLANVKDILRFRLANDLIEQLRQIGRLSLRIAENVQQG